MIGCILLTQLDGSENPTLDSLSLECYFIGNGGAALSGSSAQQDSHILNFSIKSMMFSRDPVCPCFKMGQILTEAVLGRSRTFCARWWTESSVYWGMRQHFLSILLLFIMCITVAPTGQNKIRILIVLGHIHTRTQSVLWRAQQSKQIWWNKGGKVFPIS